MTTVLFRIFDPRPQGADANEAIFALGKVFGVEVTAPALAARCDSNIDPQHTAEKFKMNVDPAAAIEVAFNLELDPARFEEDQIVLATVRADLDSIGAMVIIAEQIAGNDISGMKSRVELVAQADKFARGGWRKSTLPSMSNLWPEESASAESSAELAAIAAAVADFKILLDTRVEWMKSWLLTGEEPAGYRAKVENERMDLVHALESDDVKVSQTFNQKVVVVITKHRAATMIGYASAPVVVALNPEFSFQGSEPHRKFTICQFTGEYVDLKSATEALNVLEFGSDWKSNVEAAAFKKEIFPVWGGSPTIVGSPQGVSSKLTVQQVAETVIKHLK